MERQTTNRAPLIVAVFLLVPSLYTGSYLSLVVPDGIEREGIVDHECIAPRGYFISSSRRFLDALAGKEAKCWREELHQSVAIHAVTSWCCQTGDERVDHLFSPPSGDSL